MVAWAHNNYKVSYRSEASIAAIACTYREWAGVSNLAHFSVARIIKKLTECQVPKKGQLSIKYIDDESADPFVTYNPLTLHVPREMMEFSDLGDADSNYKLAHELGHIILHDHHAQNFSKFGTSTIKAFADEETAEWQAHTFADHFLAPDNIVRNFTSEDELRAACNLNQSVAKKRIVATKAKRPIYEGESCPECQNFTLVRNGTCLKCDTCGSTTGCS